MHFFLRVCSCPCFIQFCTLVPRDPGELADLNGIFPVQEKSKCAKFSTRKSQGNVFLKV